MKISVTCLCVLLIYTCYWAFGCTFYLASAEDAVPTVSASASLFASENITNSNKSDNATFIQSEHNVVKSDNSLDSSADIRSSFEDIPNTVDSGEQLNQPDFAFAEVVSQNSGVANEVGDTTQGIAYTLVDSATAELQQRAENIPSAITSHNETPNLVASNLIEKPVVVLNTKVEPVHKINISVETTINQGSDDLNNTQQTDDLVIDVPNTEPKENTTKQSKETSEEIPSFSEWSQKQLEEAEKKKELVNSSLQNQSLNGKANSNSKKRSKNYASPDCGAKIVAANPEAISAGSVLSSSRDEYKLNTCTSRIWFIVELCEAIQAKKVDLANFELFSSSPKDFSISVSDRFPSREWSSVGHFTAKDERDIQSFDLHPHLFGKYIKFEMHSHHGSEHYCPISLFRVYGTSEFEVLETEDQVHVTHPEDDDDDETLDSVNGDSPKNLFSSATDAVMSIVKKAAEVLGNKGNNSSSANIKNNATRFQCAPLLNSCATPSHIVVCDNCSDRFYEDVFEILSCQARTLNRLVHAPLIKETLYNSDICYKYGLGSYTKSMASSWNTNYISFVSSIFSPRYLAAMCNTIAIIENKVVRNTSHCSNSTKNLTLQNSDILNIVPIESEIQLQTKDTVDDAMKMETTQELGVEKSNLTTKPVASEVSVLQIKPTKTLNPPDIDSNDTVTFPYVESGGYMQTASPTESVTTQNVLVEQNSTTVSQNLLETVEVNTESLLELDTTGESSEGLDDLVTELNGDSASVAASTTPPPIVVQKESVFLRLSNRIKALERNMSLSSQYLEELSRRYKKQVEEMQRLLDKTINTLNEESQKRDQRTEKLEEKIHLLTSAVEALTIEKNKWITTVYWLFLAGTVSLSLFLFCRRSPNPQHGTAENGAKNSEVQRRKSIDVVRQKTPAKKKRRSSEETVKIEGTYDHLLIDEIDSSGPRSKEKKRKRKKPLLGRSISISTLIEESPNNDPQSGIGNFAPKTTSSRIWRTQETDRQHDWVDGSLLCNGIQEIPFVLEDSEHTSLETLPCDTVSQKNQNVRPQENGDIKQPLNSVHVPLYMKTAVDLRAKRNSRSDATYVRVQPSKNGTHRKSASVDETKTRYSPVPVSSDNSSLSSTCFEDPNVAPIKKEKKGTLKKLFKGFTFK